VSYGILCRVGFREAVFWMAAVTSMPTSAPGLPTSAPGLPTSAPGLPTSAPGLPTSAPGLATSSCLRTARFGRFCEGVCTPGGINRAHSGSSQARTQATLAAERARRARRADRLPQRALLRPTGPVRRGRAHPCRCARPCYLPPPPPTPARHAAQRPPPTRTASTC
jgi:hypothetical protein